MKQFKYEFMVMDGFQEKKKILDGDQWLFKYDNGYGASVVQHSGSYGGQNGLYEIAVLDSNGEMSYTTPITDDVIGYADEVKLYETLDRIKSL
mgnify:FL=1